MNTATRQVLPAPPESWQEIRRCLQAMVQGWAYAAYLDTCGSTVDRYGKYEVLAAGSRGGELLLDWQTALEATPGWWLGIIPYELGRVFHPQVAAVADAPVVWPELAFFRPDWVSWIDRENEEWVIEGWVGDLPLPASFEDRTSLSPEFHSNFSEQAYLETVEVLQEHIREGQVYEINLTQVFAARVTVDDTFALYLQLIQSSPVPFSAWIRFGEKVLINASPERFLQRKGDRLTTQPIKGTLHRGQNNQEDEALKVRLRHSEKEQAENVMIVDLSRHDLNRVCLPGTVEVADLFEVQTFPTVHQLVSTIQGTVAAHMPWQQLLAGIFPPGSMTGAPKQRAMQLIGEAEGLGRGAYAGSAGYMDPSGNFDFNVVIRSLIYDGELQKLVYQVGGAITIDSDPAAEYAETLLKASAIRGLFGQNKKDV